MLRAVFRAARQEDVRDLVEMMAEAFADDPLYVWLQPEPRRREEMLREVFAFVLALGLDHGEVHTTDARDAVAVWTAPGVGLVDEGATEVYLGLLRAHIGDERLGDVMEGMAAMDRHRPDEPTWTLHSVATAHPGSGVGSALLRVVLDRGGPAYLDSSNPRNLTFYARLGFEVVAEEPLRGDGPVMRALVRA